MNQCPTRTSDINTTCPYCGVGCGVTMSAERPDADTISWRATGTGDHPANQGRLCVKGSALGDTVQQGQRLLVPEVDGQRCDWRHAIDQVASRLRTVIDQYGPDAVAFYVSGQLLTEDYYVANKLMKGFIGSGNIDTNSRLCMSTAVAAHKQVLGSDTVAGCYDDLEQADLLVITGSNMAWTHPVVYQRIAAARQRRPDMRVVVIDPRRTATCDLADIHLAISPGTDGFLFDGLFAWLVKHGHVDQTFIDHHCEGFDSAAAESLARFRDLAQLAETCAVKREQLETFFAWFATTERTVTVFSQGINQSSSGVGKAAAILHCHLATGRIGKPGATPFSITGQPNAMGGREVGGLANQLAAHMDFGNDRHHQLVADFWQTTNLARSPGLKAVEMFDAVHDGRIKAIWIMATNPVVSLPDADRVREALKRCPTVIVSDCVDQTDTLACADIRLPAAAWGEKEGTVTNSERCISRQRAFMVPPGDAMPDWWIISSVARRMGFAQAFDYQRPADIFREHAALTGHQNGGSRDLDLSGLSTLTDADYDTLVPVQWPVSREIRSGTARLYADGHFFTPSGRARFVSTRPSLPARRTSQDFPFWLNTGRIRDQWHTMTRTGRSARLLAHIEEPFVAMHPEDLLASGLREGQIAELQSPAGTIHVPVRSDAGQQRGSVFVPIHWNDQFASAARVDSLVPAITDPESGQPEFKQVPVAVRSAGCRWHACVVGTRRPALAANSLYWSRRPVGELEEYRFAGNAQIDLAAVKSALAADADNWAEISDPAIGHYRLTGYRDGRPVVWLAVAPERPTPDSDWLTAVLTGHADADPLAVCLGRPLHGADSSAVVCSCHQVREQAVIGVIQAGQRDVAGVGRACGAGTNCGSCIPEITALIDRHHNAAKEAP